MAVVRFSLVGLSLVLIVAGAVLMLLSIFKFRSVMRRTHELLPHGNRKIYYLSKYHQVSMVFFLVGYLAVGGALYHDIQIVWAPFVGAIFFFGALFVLFGIYLQSHMLSSIRLQHRELTETNRQLLKTESVTIFALAYQAELRDQETGKHIERTSHYVRLLARELARFPRHKGYLTPSYIADLVKSAPLHDIGKVGIPDSILQKPGRLTADEFETIKKHCEYGMQVLRIADEKLSFQSFLKIAIQVVHTHHEKWNGTGYPQGLKGEAIPLSGRIMALADVYDALRSDRCYKKALSHQETCELILAEKGKHFDPDIVDAFFNIHGKFERISRLMADS